MLISTTSNIYITIFVKLPITFTNDNIGRFFNIRSIVTKHLCRRIKYIIEKNANWQLSLQIWWWTHELQLEINKSIFGMKITKILEQLTKDYCGWEYKVNLKINIAWRNLKSHPHFCATSKYCQIRLAHQSSFSWITSNTKLAFLQTTSFFLFLLVEMLRNLLINFYALKELICQYQYKKIKRKTVTKNARSGSIANFV